MRRTSSAVVFALALVACGDSAPVGSADPSTTTAGATTSPPSTGAPGTTGATATTSAPMETTTRVRPDGEAAPDFTLALALGDGGTFTLSDEQKPVYMVFWAEW